MLVREGAERTEEADRQLACSLAAVAGALNATAFLAAGFFAANMTGNVSLLSAHIGTGEIKLAAGIVALVLAFVAGAAVSSLLVVEGRRRGVRRIYATVILAEAVLLAALGILALAVPALAGAEATIVGLAFLMGLQNAVVTRISQARVRTTHVSGMVTDIGIELGHLAGAALGRGGNTAADRARLRLHAETVASFLVGGTVGVLAWRALGAGVLLVAAAALFAIALMGLLRRPAAP